MKNALSRNSILYNRYILKIYLYVYRIDLYNNIFSIKTETLLRVFKFILM